MARLKCRVRESLNKESVSSSGYLNTWLQSSLTVQCGEAALDFLVTSVLTTVIRTLKLPHKFLLRLNELKFIKD